MDNLTYEDVRIWLKEHKWDIHYSYDEAPMSDEMICEFDITDADGKAIVEDGEIMDHEALADFCKDALSLIKQMLLEGWLNE